MLPLILEKLQAEGWPNALIGLAQWRSLPEDDDCRLECGEGMVQLVPSPTLRHQLAVSELGRTLRQQLPAGLLVVPDYDVLVIEDPLTVRRPDLIVTSRAALTEPQPLSVGMVDLAIEVVSPGSASVDRVLKRSEYAGAGIRSYWILDLDQRSLTVLSGPGYADVETHFDALDAVVAGSPVHVVLASVIVDA